MLNTKLYVYLLWNHVYKQIKTKSMWYIKCVYESILWQKKLHKKWIFGSNIQVEFVMDVSKYFKCTMSLCNNGPYLYM